MTKKKDPLGRLSWAQWDFDAWASDAELASCSMAAQGLWMRLLCVAWKNDGYVLINGKSPSAAALARLVRASEEEVIKWLEELRENGVTSVAGWADNRNVLFSRRMVRELRTRKAARENGAKGGNPNLVTGERLDRLRPVSVRARNGLMNGNDTGNPEGVNPEIEIEIERESESRERNENRAPKTVVGGPSKMPLEDYFEDEKNGHKSADPEKRKAEAWFMAKSVLEVFGSSAAAAGKLVGEIARDYSLTADEIANIALRIFEAKPERPRPFAIGCAKQVARERTALEERRAGPTVDLDYQRRVMREYQLRSASFPTREFGGFPGGPGCTIDGRVLAEFGVAPFSPGDYA